LLVALVSLLAVAAAMEPLAPPMKVPDVTVSRGKEKPAWIKSRVSDPAILILVLTGAIPKENCDALSRVVRALEQ
jgi:hypothetical protein